MSIGLISNINLEYLKKIIQKKAATEVLCSEVNQFYQYFLDTENKFKKLIDYLFIWPSPETISNTYQKLKNYETPDQYDITNEIKEYVARLKLLSAQHRNLFVPLFQDFDYPIQSGIADMQHERGISETLIKMNYLLIDKLKESKNIHILDSYNWFKNATSPIDEKLLLRAQIPFSTSLMNYIADSIIAGISTVEGKQKKLIVLDLDNTIWGGVIGDEGYENIKIGGHDYEGEAYLKFQKNLKKLKNRGILLSIASKNNENTVIEAFEKNDHMNLKLEDFVVKKINWTDKAQNIREIASEINIGLDSIVFIDDSPYERDRVKEDIPELFVPEFPNDPSELSSWLNNLNCFNSVKFTNEDLERSRSIINSIKASKFKSETSDLNEWIAGLKINVNIEELSRQNFDRSLQLINKTNQMNLSTNRYSANELIELMDNSEVNLFTVKVKDRISDEELMGFFSLKKNKQKIRILDFILSCRAFGKNIEDTMVCAIELIAKKTDKEIEKVNVKITEKNKVCQSFFENYKFGNIKNITTFENGIIKCNELNTSLDLKF